MAVAALDTLSLTKRLRAAGFTEDQAEAVTEVVSEASKLYTSSLATKPDLAELKAEILKWLFGMIGVQTTVIPGALVTLIRMGSPALR